MVLWTFSHGMAHSRVMECCAAILMGGETVIESANSQNDVPLETSMPDGAVSLESILCTEELPNRPWRPPDHEKENSALVALTSALADSPRTILQTLADKVLEILHADSAGLSLLTKDEKRFYWAAIAGAWRPHIGGGTPRDFGPCGDVLDHNIPMLFTHWERRYPYLSTAMPLADEGLLVPFYVNGKAVGTIWAIAHNNRRKFDAEDLRLLESMSRFASAAYQAVESIEDLKLEIASREKAETELSELNDGLEAQVRVRTEELEQRNKQLADARARLAEEKLRLERSEAYMAEAQRLSHTGSWHLNASSPVTATFR
jgi:DNA-binding transcriptional MerR regulator